MPVIEFRVAELERLLGKKVPRDELARTIPMIGADVDRADGEEWAIEFFPNRPDLYTVEGIARALRAFYDVRPGISKYRVSPAKHTIYVDPSVAAVRPHIVGAFVRGVEIPEHRLKAIIEVQEDLHWGLGARRRRVAIGVHDAKELEPPFYYLTTPPEGISFVPLQETRSMTAREILEKHPKGQDYAHLLKDRERYPVILDAEGQVLSMPPIINGTLTTVTTSTKDLFLDVTGTDLWACEKALNLLATSLAESGGRIEAVTLRRLDSPADARGEGSASERLDWLRRRLKSDKRGWKLVKKTPDLSPERRRLRVSEVRRLLGVDLPAAKVARCLERMGYGARPAGSASVQVLVPAYRVDVLHEWDLIEDVAIGYGINDFERDLPRAPTSGAALPGALLAERARDALVGQGFHEVMSLSLSNPEDQFTRMGLPRGSAVEIKNPLTEEHTILRVSTLPSLLNVLKKNAHRDLPQRLFEVGVVTVHEAGDAPQPERRVGGVVVSSRANFSEVKGIVLGFARDLGWWAPENAPVEKGEHSSFIPGRCARLGDKGFFGELSPATITAFGLAHPVVAFEFLLEKIPPGTHGAKD